MQISPLPSLKNHETQVSIYCYHSSWYFWHVEFPPPALISTDHTHTQKAGAPRTREGLVACPPNIDSSSPPGIEELLWLSRVQILVLLFTCCVIVGKVFECSFSSLNWDDTVDLTIVVRIEPGSVLKLWSMPDLWTGVQYIMAAITHYFCLIVSTSLIRPVMCVLYVVVQKKTLALHSFSVFCIYDS